MAPNTSNQTTQPFDSFLNFRDVGLTINSHPSVPHPLLQTSLLYRSARPDSATPSDRHRLTHDYKIHTILDLRTKTEQLARQQNSPSISTPSTSLSKIPGITYAEINFNGSAFSRALMRRLSWSNAAKLIGLYTFNYRTEAISILGENVITPRGLTGLAEDSLTYSTAEVAAVFAVLANAASYPVLVHCTQGKDRTGLVVLLVLLLLGVPMEAVESDYARSAGELEVERRERVKEMRAIGLGEAFAESPVSWVGEVCRFIDGKWGGVEAYLEACGVTREQIASIRRILGAGGMGEAGSGVHA